MGGSSIDNDWEFTPPSNGVPDQVIRSRLQQRPSKGGTPIYMDSWHVVKETAR